MPRRCEGVAASAHSAATTGVSSPTSCRSRSTPWSASGPRHPQPVVDVLDRAAHRGQDLAQRVAGLGGLARPVADGDRAAGHRGQGQERRRVGEVGLDHAVDAPRSVRARPPSGWRRRRRPSTPCSRSIATVISMCGSDGTGLPSWRTSTPCVEAGAGEQQRRDELRGRRGVDDDRAAGHRARCRVRRTAARRGRRRRSRRPAPAARRAPGRPGGCACAASPSKRDRADGQRRHRRHEPHHGARPGRSRRWRRRRTRPGVTAQSSPVVSTVGAERGQGGGHQQGVARAQRAAYDRRAVGERGQHQRAVGWRLAAGQRDGRVDRTGRARAPATGRRGSVTPRSLSADVSSWRLASLASRRAVVRRGGGLAACVLGRAAGPPGHARLAVGVDRRRSPGRRTARRS